MGNNHIGKGFSGKARQHPDAQKQKGCCGHEWAFCAVLLYQAFSFLLMGAFVLKGSCTFSNGINCAVDTITGKKKIIHRNAIGEGIISKMAIPTIAKTEK